MFKYGNYDGKMAPPTFDIHVGVNYWSTVVMPDSESAYFYEIITTTSSDYLQVCLINTDRGTPFISALELRQMETTLYKDANATQSLVRYRRYNMGADDFVR
ncbi:Leucine-rich repeat protein kinase family protein [Rhynchospora pubera]|uniref:Leucine-rich repeat protein kinase family protein n=1 Tax=Rhynchospora pubera TaxID=906938 RepID=A0AAV8EP56_9POAL|nr:Leucine-rich repeat protein kinase family protein [Rhynchospora pubera]